MDTQVNWEQEGIIFNIQRFSLHDGKGIRTIVFLKGCALNCMWCSNPESHKAEKELLHIERNCIRCDNCINVCENNAITVVDGKIIILKDKCNVCGKCTQVCFAKAMQISGKKTTVRTVMQEVERDMPYYKFSNGGVTLSGGEALLQADFAREILKASKNIGLNTAVETANFIERSNLIKVIPYIDMFLADLKIFDSQRHKKYTGQHNETILDNIKYIASLNKKIIIRIPVISQINDDIDNIFKIAEFAKTNGIDEVNLLPYHMLGVNKYSYLGEAYLLNDIKPPASIKMEELKEVVERIGIKCKIGG